MESNDNGRPDAGEDVSFDVKLANKGTVTLEIFSVADSSESAGCTRSESFLLRQEEQHKCTVRRQVLKYT